MIRIASSWRIGSEKTYVANNFCVQYLMQTKRIYLKNQKCFKKLKEKNLPKFISSFPIKKMKSQIHIRNKNNKKNY